MKPRDFTLAIYGQLLDAFQHAGYGYQTFTGFLTTPGARTVMLRHDVDDRRSHSLTFARLQAERGVVGTYYFRMVPQSFDREVIREIHGLGHEIGYHYEEMDLCHGDVAKAYDLFRSNLDRLRAVAPITTICMHGSPRSPYDNKELWKHFDYRDHGILGEPYFDLDFKRVAYYTDTGRRWDGDRFSVRDHAYHGDHPRFHHTDDIVRSLRLGGFPAQAMLNFHPQRWTDDRSLWLRDRLVQTAKNYAKYGMIKWRERTAPPTP